MTTVKLQQCADCNGVISINANPCPHCGSKNPSGAAGTLGGAAILCVLISLFFFWMGHLLVGVVLVLVATALFFSASGLQRELSVETDNRPASRGLSFNVESRSETSYEPPHQEKYWEVIENVHVPASLNFDYINGKGESTNRTVEISNYNGTCYLNGFCQLKDEYRTFRIDRIGNCVDADTGEVIQDVPEHLRQKYLSSPEYKLTRVFESAKDIINVLLFVGKADSQLRAEEISIICGVIKKIAKDNDLPEENIKKKLKQLPVPSLHAFKLAVGRIQKENHKNLPVVQLLATKIVNTQKTINPREQEALDYIKKKVDEHARKTNSNRHAGVITTRSTENNN